MLGKHVDVVLGEGELNFIFYYMEGGLLVVRGGCNHPYLRPVAELRRTQIKGPVEGAFGSRHTVRQLATDHSLDLGVDFTEGGNPSKHGRDYLQLYRHEFQVFY